MSVKILEYPLSPKYIPNWTIAEALRELMANALDIDDSPEISWEDGRVIISDNGPGIAKSFWVIGEGNHGSIGQFGEGLKMAMLVLAREERTVTVATPGYSVEPSIIYSDTYESTVLALAFTDKAQYVPGTVIQVECSEDEYANARGKFLKLEPQEYVNADLGILKDAGSLYITGVYVSRIPALWGYDVPSKELANRDRSVLDGKGVEAHVGKVLGQLNDVALISAMMAHAIDNPESRSTYVEYSAYIRPADSNHPAWCAAFKDVFGDKACISSNNTDDDNYLIGEGFTVVGPSLPWYLRDALRTAGVLTSLEAIKAFNDVELIASIGLTESEADTLHIAHEIAISSTLASDVEQVIVVDEFPARMGGGIQGAYRKQTVYILRSALQSLAIATGILIHERLHGMGYDDVSREFESYMTVLLGELAVKAVSVRAGVA